METIGDLLAAAGERSGPALTDAGRTRSYADLRARVYKTGNLLRHQGVSESSTVAVLDRPDSEPLFCLLGAWLLGAATRLEPPTAVDARVLFGPTDALEEYDASPRTRRIGYGGPPTDPAWVHFERDAWSENPAFPEPSLDPATPALVGDETHDQATLLAAAERVAADVGLEAADAVAVRAPLADPGTVVAGVLAPLRVGATVLLPPAPAEPDEVTDPNATGTVAVAEGAAPEATVVSPSSVTF